MTNGVEDCLVVNVFSHDVGKVKEPKPVMVWIHGGGFTVGSGNDDFYGPQRFMSEDIVSTLFRSYQYVTLNAYHFRFW